MTVARLGAAELRKVSPRLESTSDVACESSDVGSLSARHTDGGLHGFGREIHEFDAVDAYVLRLQLHVGAIATEVVGTLAVHLARAERRRNLFDVAHELCQNLLQRLTCDGVSREGLVHGVLHVVAGSGGTELQRGDILLAVELKFLNALREASRAEHQHTGGKRIECAGMAYLDALYAKTLADAGADKRQGTEARHTERLVNGDNFALGEIHSVSVCIYIIMYIVYDIYIKEQATVIAPTMAQ